jgi:hypothetical protein
MSTLIYKNNVQTGPFEDAQILQGMGEGVYSPDDLGWREGLANWTPLRELFPQAAATRAVPPAVPRPLPRAVQPQRLGDNAGIRMLLPVGRSGWAIAAGYLGLFSLIILPAPIALVISTIAIWDIRRSKNTDQPKHGMGRAIFGLIMGILGTAFLLVGLFATVLRR